MPARTGEGASASPEIPSLTDQLRAAIRTSGQSLRALGRLSGIPSGNLSAFLNGKRGLSLDGADKLCRVLRLGLAPLEVHAEQPPPEDPAPDAEQLAH